MDRLFVTYRNLAYVVGVLLVVASITSVLKYLTPDDSAAQNLGEQLAWLWVIHGWIYIAYVVVAFVLARRERWSVTFTLLMLAAGLVPLLIFWVERRVAERATRASAPGPLR